MQASTLGPPGFRAGATTRRAHRKMSVFVFATRRKTVHNPWTCPGETCWPAPTPRPRPQPFARPGHGNGLDEDAARVDISIRDRNHELHLYAVAPGDGGPHRAAHIHAPLPLLAMCLRHLRRATPRTKAAIAAEVYCHAWRRLSRPAPTSWPLRRGSAMLACVSPVVGSGAAQRLWVKEVRGETAQGRLVDIVQYHEVYNGLCRPSLRRRRLRHRRRSRCAAPPLLPLAISRTGLLAQCSRPC